LPYRAPGEAATPKTAILELFQTTHASAHSCMEATREHRLATATNDAR
jgi:hypothetical protein